MKSSNIDHLVILKAEATEEQIQKLKNLTGSDKVRFNGKITTSTDFIGVKEQVKKEVADIFGISPAGIYITTSER